MKKLLLLLVAFCGIYTMAAAQGKVPSGLAGERLLVGTWVVKDKAMLPPIPEDGAKHYMLDTLIFMQTGEFKNGFADERLKTYGFSSDGDIAALVILDVEDSGSADYFIDALNKNELVFTRFKEDLSEEKTVYKRVADKK